jgi:hypothetical protein
MRTVALGLPCPLPRSPCHVPAAIGADSKREAGASRPERWEGVVPRLLILFPTIHDLRIRSWNREQWLDALRGGITVASLAVLTGSALGIL